MKIEIPAIADAFPLRAAEKELLRIRYVPDPVTWASDNFRLTTAYARPGTFKPYKYQVEPINAIRQYDKVIFCWATQTGKSLSAEVAVGWAIDCLPMNAMLCYAKHDTVEDVFEDRIKPLILEVPAVRKYFTGTEKDLRRKKIRLTHMYLRVASAEVPADIATWSAGLIYASEVSKYRKRKGWDPLESLKRRQEAYRILGRHKAIFESSPLNHGDALYQEMHQPGTLILKPYQPCPLCGQYQHLTYTQIKERPNAKGEVDHDPDRIRRDKAAWYECIHCHKEIPESARVGMAERVVYVGAGEKITPDGRVFGRKETKNVCFQVNRLVDHSYTFVECLARWFSAMKKDVMAMQTFINEDEAEFWSDKTSKVDAGYLEKCKMDYYQWKGGIPNEVLVLMAGIDCQDNGFFWVVNGYGKGMDKFLVRSGFVESEKGVADGPKAPSQAACDRLQAAIWGSPYTRKDGRTVDIRAGFIDRGGHRADDVDYICEHLPQFRAYIGSTGVDFRKPLVSPSPNGRHYMGQSQLLSTEMTQIIASKRFHLPMDVSPDYLEQVRNEYVEERKDVFGNTKQVYVKIDPNHYRSAENLCLAAVKYEGLAELLFDDSSVRDLSRQVNTPEEIEREANAAASEDDSDYFSTRGRGRWRE